MTRRNLTWLVLASSALASNAAAERIDLSEAMARARQQARPVAAAERRVEAGEERLRQAKAFRLPKITLREIWMRTDAPAEAFALQLQQERFSFPAFVSSDPNDPDPIENALTRLELTLPVYTGGELSGRIGQAELAADAARERAAWAEDGAALAAAEAYIQLAQVNEQVALLERSLETVRAHVQTAGSYVEQGMLVRSELLRAQVEQSRIEDLLSGARGMAKVAEAAFSFYLAADLSSHWELEELPEPAPLSDPLDSWIGSALDRSDLAAAHRMLEAGELEIRVKRSGYKPKIGVAARYDWNDDSLFGTHGDASALMAVASIDLFGGGRHRAAAAAAEAEVEAGRKEILQFEEGIRLSVKSAYERAVSARERHRTAQAALEAARENARIVDERFRQGVVKTLDLLDANTAQREAETRELVARVNAHLESLRLAVEAGRRPESVLP